MNKGRKFNHSSRPGDLLADESNGKLPLINKDLIYRIILGVLLILGITFLYPIEKIYLPLDIPTLAEVVTDDIVAPFDFPIYKSPEELERDRQIVLANLKPVLSIDTATTRVIYDKTDALFELVDSLIFSNINDDKILATLKYYYPNVPDSIWVPLLVKRTSDYVKHATNQIIDTLLSSGIVADLNSLPLQSSGLVTISSPDKIRTMVREKVYTLASAQYYAAQQSSTLIKGNPEADVSVTYFVTSALRPNLLFDREKTELSRKTELEAIPLTKGMVFKGEKIISANERVTEICRDKLVSLAKYKRLKQPGHSLWEYFLPPMGRLFFVAFPILFLLFFLYSFKHKIYASNSDLLLFAVLIAGEILLLNIVISQNILSKYLVPFTIASMLATILYDEEVGLIFTVSLAMLVGVLSGFRLDIAFVTIIGGTVACFSVRHVRHRHDFYRPMIYLCLAYGGSVYIIESLKLTPYSQLWTNIALAMTNGFLSPILTIGLLPLFETSFGITTDITLLELSDLNRPLLKRLALEAPGTYHHSIMIGTLAEDAAESIGANSLLARVGSYYHDIGKMQKPEYFVENQLDAENKHEKLAPTMSALILEAHVKEGIELAQKFGLPRTIIEFITGHHGTGIMSYFYDKAKNEIGDSADVRDFRYPGPNPRSKEVAIVMLADSVEAASRTLDDPKPARIRNLIHRIFLDKLDRGLLENSDLTLRDIKRIEDSFVRVLTAFFHRRVKYPEPKEIAL